MASNQVSNRRHSNGANPPQPARRPAAETAEDYMTTAKEYVSDVADQATQYWSQGQQQMRGMVRGREGTTLLVAVAAGVGVGLVIGAALGRSHSQSMSSQARRTAEGFGRRLMDRIEGMIPDALAEHFAKS
jgi:hypothetical protein